MWEAAQGAVKALANLLLRGILVVHERSVLAKCVLLMTSVESADTCACSLFACKIGGMRCES